MKTEHRLAWLRSVLAEHEETAKAAGLHGPTWMYETYDYAVSYGLYGASVADVYEDAVGHHIATHNPDGVAARINAERALIDLYEETAQQLASVEAAFGAGPLELAETARLANERTRLEASLAAFEAAVNVIADGYEAAAKAAGQ